MNSTINFLGALYVSLGAAVGALARWGLGAAFNTVLPHLPLGTLAANLGGGFLMGLMLGLIEAGGIGNPNLRLLIMTGFLGGLTTFSAFTGESLILLHKHQYVWALLHSSMHVFGCLLMAAIGFFAAHCLNH
ncbi:MAG: fluoride efflux transporter CrcB [Betaproteobacteria bacterium]|nr:fluoride efflux transporter CrcB [Betaproteobacteria bacterium]